MPASSYQFFSVTSDRALAERWRAGLAPLGGTHSACDGLMTALRRLIERPVDIALIDPSGTDLSVDAVLQKIRLRAPSADLILVTEDSPGTGSERPQTDRAVLERWGAIQLSRDLAAAELSARLNAIGADRARVARCGWVGLSPSLRAASELLLSAAPSEATVLIEGESGSGKELAARAIHQNSPRANCQFMALNCSAFTETILESELFGHEKGAFTDAFGRKKGVFEAVDGGTIFLDEIGETTPGVQSRLLRVLEERQVRRVGSVESIPVDFRIVAATNRNLSDTSSEGRFRRDLYFRLAVVQLTLPSLRDHRGDVPALLEHHFNVAAKAGAAIRLLDRVTEVGLVRLIDYDWPGNVRELRNFVERANVHFPGRVIGHEQIGELLTSVRPAMLLPVPTGRRTDVVEREMIFAALSELKRDLDYLKRAVTRFADQPHHDGGGLQGTEFRSMKETERERITEALQLSNGNRAKAARMLGIGERTLYRKIRQYGL
ncbi:MAG: sigma-54-dependent Fis family transcriptional regulator [candidate division Zixibacteria bacterium]|nr:sigma-54-dependent Fis family transcriptional regulator [candidate division Zixibacteria bacterium]